MQFSALRSWLKACAVVCAGAVLLASAPARAQVDGWQFGGSVYMWFAGCNAKVQSGPASGSEVNVSFSEIFTSSWAPPPIMLAAEARNGRFGIAMDLIYLDLESKLSTKGILFSGGKAEFSSLEWTVEGFYRFYEDPTFKLDAGAGFRLWSAKTKLTLKPGLLDGRTAKVNETFVDPIVALRANIILGNAWSITALGDVGGFGIQLGLYVAGSRHAQLPDHQLGRDAGRLAPHRRQSQQDGFRPRRADRRRHVPLLNRSNIEPRGTCR